MTPLVLASASVTRARLLAAAGVDFEAFPAAMDEEAFRASWQLGGGKLAGALASEKARKVAAQRPGRVVLGADQVLLLDDIPLGKCATPEEARALLLRLRGRTHRLATGAVLVRAQEVLWQFTAACDLAMRDFSDAFLDDYLARANGALTRSVGAYEVEGLGLQLFARVDGDFFSVLGLPMLPLLAELRRLGLVPA